MGRAERHIELTFQGEKFTYYPGRASPKLARECRRIFDVGPAELWVGWFRRPTVEADQVAEMLWLARRQMADFDGTRVVSLDEIDAQITADAVQDAFTIEFRGFGIGDDDTDRVPEIDRVTEVVDVIGPDGDVTQERAVAPDPEG